jgi:PadR family transcriptional regulator, regulatory protein PadR
MTEFRRSRSMTAVLTLMADGQERHGYEIMRTLGYTSGVTYPLLHRLVARGQLTSRDEKDIDPVAAGRPRRRYYRIRKEA